MDWIEKLRQKRIKDADEKYGPYTLENFLKNQANGTNYLQETIEELVDAITRTEQCRMLGLISEGLEFRISWELKRLMNILKLNE